MASDLHDPLADTRVTSEPLLPVQTSPVSQDDEGLSSELPHAQRYADSAPLGSGGMGEVLLVRDRRVGRSVALKRLHTRVGSKNALLRFVREARIQGQLEHPSIVPVYDLGADPEGGSFFTMRHIRGRTLEQLLRSLQSGHEGTRAQYTRRKLLTLFSSICLTVHYAHSRGVLHRDLKPANVMVGEFGEVYVLDWGIAKVLGQGEELDLGGAAEGGAGMTAAGSVMGTLGYMAPEQLRGEVGALDARADVYALGMILYELLTFERFHGPEDPGAAYHRTLRGHDAVPSQRDPTVPPELDELFRQATALRPEDRLDSARKLSNAVEQFLDGDRDTERRQELAAGHAARAHQAAEAALREGVGGEEAARQRVEALQEITRALALDPGQVQARAVLGRLLTTPPREMPPGVQGAMERSLREAQRKGLRFGSLIYLSWLGVIGYVLFMGVKSWVAFAIPTTGVALILAHVASLRLRGTFGPLDRRLLAVLTFGTIAAFSVWLGPFVLVPLATACGALIFSIQAERRERWFYLLVATAASILPFAAEASGLFPPAYTFENGALVLLPRAVELSPRWTLLGLLYLSVSFTLVPAYYLGRVRDSLTSAEEKLFLHAWHFEQLTGAGAPGEGGEARPGSP
jgi:serine/threonine-protein kinase